MSAAAFKPRLLQLLLGFGAIYIIWGSTYLAMRFAVESIPPFIMCGARFFLGGLGLYAWSRWRGAPVPTASEWKYAAIVGTLLMVGGTGVVAWCSQYIPSGLIALIIATVPLWIVLIEWIRPNGVKPTALMGIGVAMGLVGVGLLITPGRIAGGDQIDTVAGLILICGCLSWASGSVASRYAPLPKSLNLSASMQLIVSGIVLIGISLLSGEFTGLDWSTISNRSLWSTIYLTVLGTLAFAAYIWVIQATSPAKASTYAFVNPVIAVFLGVTLGGEDFNSRVLISSIIIISAVVLIIASRRPRPPYEIAKKVARSPVPVER